MNCHCGNTAILYVTMGCGNMHVTDIGYCPEHSSPVHLPLCHCGLQAIQAYLFHVTSGAKSLVNFPEGR